MKKGKKLSMQHFKKPSARVLKSILTTSYIGNYFKIKMITNIFKHHLVFILSFYFVL